MIKYFAGTIAGYGEIFARMQLIQSYGGAYRLYAIVGVDEIYWTSGPIVLTSAFQGLHIAGSEFDANAFNTFAEAKQAILARLEQGRADLQQAITQVDHMIRQVSGVGE
jgi:hypothetical protein